MTESPMGDSPLKAAFSRPLSDEDLRAARRGLDIKAEADAAERAGIARLHGLLALNALSYTARLEPYGKAGWRLTGRVRADVAQACVVTLDPVPATMDEPFERLWSPDAPEAGDLAEAGAGRLDLMDRHFSAHAQDLAEQSGWSGASNDDPQGEEPPELERTPDPIDPATAALETFTLSLDPYPRAPGADFAGAVYGPPGEAPLTDEAAKPFAGLEGLRDALADQENAGAAPTSANSPNADDAAREEASKKRKKVFKNGDSPPDAEKA